MAYGFRAVNGVNKIVIDDNYQAANLIGASDTVERKTGSRVFPLQCTSMQMIALRLNVGEEIGNTFMSAYNGGSGVSDHLYYKFDSVAQGVFELAYRKIAIFGGLPAAQGYGMRIWNADGVPIYDSNAPVVSYLGFVVNSGNIPSGTTHVILGDGDTSQRQDGSRWENRVLTARRDSPTYISREEQTYSTTPSYRPGGQQRLVTHCLRIS